MLPLLLLPLAWADMEPPDFGRVLAREQAAVLEALNAQGQHAEVVEAGERFQREIVPSAEVEYEVAFAWSALGERERARRHYRRAVELDPDDAASWYDLGEILLRDQDLDAAEEAFSHAAALRSDHWAGHFRLAEIAARRHQPDPFEQHLRDALRAGFSFRVVLGDANWAGYYREPALREVLRRLVTVYSDERLLDAFEQEDLAP